MAYIPSPVVDLDSPLTKLQSEGCTLISLEQLATVSLILKAHSKSPLFEVEACDINHCLEYAAETLDINCEDGIGTLQAEADIDLVDFGKIQECNEETKLHRCVGRVGKAFRHGFWLSDCYGFGKTRILAALVVEYNVRKVEQVVYFCRSHTSMTTFLNELTVLGLVNLVYCDLQTLEAMNVSDKGKLQVLLVLYDDLKVDDKFKNVLAWLGPNSQALVRTAQVIFE